VRDLSLLGTDDQKQRLPTPFMRGEIRCPISMSEPKPGRPYAKVETCAQRAGDEYVV